MSEQDWNRGLLLPPTMSVAVALALATARRLPVLIGSGSELRLLTLAQLERAEPASLLGELDGSPAWLVQMLPNNECWFTVELAKGVQILPTADGKLGLPDRPDPELPVTPDLRPHEPADADAASPPDPALRKANLWLRYGDEPVTIDDHTTLAVNESYRLCFNIGLHRADSWLGADAAPVPTPAIPEAGLELLVSVVGAPEVLEFPAALQPLLLPRDGDSAMLEFGFTPRQLSADTVVWVHIYYRWTLVQTIELHCAVTQREQDLAAPLPPASVRYSRADDWNDLEQLRPAAVNLRMWEQSGAYRLAVVWPDLLPSGRRDPRRGFELTLPINAQTLTDTIIRVRDDLYSITTHSGYRLGVQGRLKEYRESLFRLAEAGNRLYAALFAPAGATAAQIVQLHTFSAWLRDLMAGDAPPQISVTHEAPGVGLPWGLLYPEPVRDANDVRPELFWGCRYELEIMTASLAVNAREAPAVRSAINIGGGTYNFGPTAAHLAALQALDAANTRIHLDLRDRTNRSELATLLGASDIVYMFCHGHTASTTGAMADGMARLRALLEQARRNPTAFADLLAVEQDSYQAPDADLSEDWLRWTNARLPLHHLTQWALELPRRPLVLLNMCESAQVLPTISGGFVPFFIQLGARGVLGTECPMLATFAAAWGEALLERLAAGERIGAILPALRRQFLEARQNPLGLAYTYYGSTDIQF